MYKQPRVSFEYRYQELIIMSSQVAFPFSVNISDETLFSLRKRLDLIIFPDELDETGSNYGAPLIDIKVWHTTGKKS